MFHSASSDAVVELAVAPFHVENTADSISHLFSEAPDALLAETLEYTLANGILPAFADRLEALGVFPTLPRDLSAALKTTLSAAAASERQERAERRSVIEVLEAARIEYLALKGAYFSHTLYPRIGTRPTRDLDILVPGSELCRVRSLLESEGFAAIPGSEEPDHHIPRLIRSRPGSDLPFAIDVHHRLVPEHVYGVRVGAMDDVWVRRVTAEVELLPGSRTRLSTLSWSDHVLHMHAHLFHHIFYNVRLMHILDIVLAFRAFRDLSPATVADQLDRLGLRTFRQDLWRWIEMLFGDRITLKSEAAPGRTCDVGRWLLRHGSLPIFAGLRYAKGPVELLNGTFHECRRYLYRSLHAPGWSFSSPPREYVKEK